MRKILHEVRIYETIGNELDLLEAWVPGSGSEADTLQSEGTAMDAKKRRSHLRTSRIYHELKVLVINDAIFHSHLSNFVCVEQRQVRTALLLRHRKDLSARSRSAQIAAANPITFHHSDASMQSSTQYTVSSGISGSHREIVSTENNRNLDHLNEFKEAVGENIGHKKEMLKIFENISGGPRQTLRTCLDCLKCGRMNTGDVLQMMTSFSSLRNFNCELKARRSISDDAASANLYEFPRIVVS